MPTKNWFIIMKKEMGIKTKLIACTYSIVNFITICFSWIKCKVTGENQTNKANGILNMKAKKNPCETDLLSSAKLFAP